VPESSKRATDGGFAAKTPQQSGAAPSGASVDGTPRVVATALHLRQAYGGHVCVLFPSARCALDLENLQLRSQLIPQFGKNYDQKKVSYTHRRQTRRQRPC